MSDIATPTTKAKKRVWRVPASPEARVSLTPEEVAGRVGCSRTSVYKALRNGELRRVKIGRRTFVRVVELDAWLSAKAAATETDAN